MATLKEWTGSAWAPVSDAVFVRRGEQAVNVHAHGATGDGVTDDLYSLRTALAATPAGGELFLPKGRYFTPYKDPTDAANYLVIDKPVTIVGQPGVVLENVLIHVKGTYGPLVPLGADLALGDKTITTTGAHGAGAGDYVQLLSAVNPYTTDGGEWQLGSATPATGFQPLARYSEIHPVDKAGSSTSLTLTDEVVYPTHRVGTIGLASPIPGVSTSHVRRLGMVRGVTFRGVTFRNTSADNFRGIIARAAADLLFEDCRFETGSRPGSMVKITDSHNVRFSRCTTAKALDTMTGSSWNTFLIGGGCHGVHFDDCAFHGEAQTVDFTPNGFATAADIGASPDTADTMLTAQFLSVTNSEFHGCSDGVTSHPATYMFEVRGNTFIGGSTGIRARSRASIITGNTIHTSRTGVALSSFLSDSQVSGNTIVQRASTKYSGYWEGVSVAATSSEIMSDNAVRNLRINDNVVKPTVPNANNSGVALFHSPPASFAPFTDAVKVRGSDITIADNDLRGCSVRVGRWVNRVSVIANRFSGGSDRSHYVLTEPDSAGNNIGGNTFVDNLAAAISTGAVTLTGHGYATTHAVGMQYGMAGMVTSLTNTRTLFGQGGALTSWDGLLLNNGGRLQALRGSGAATLNIDAVASDGTSAATVKVFGGNTTTGQKLFDVDGRVQLDDLQYPNGVRAITGTGSPEGTVSAPVGSTYHRSDGGSGSTYYVKESGGTGNTGWVAK